MSRVIAFIKIFSVILFSLFILFSCRKDEYKRITKIETTRIYGVMSTSAFVNGDIIDLGEGVTDHGHCWALSHNPGLSDSLTSFGKIDKRGSYTSELKNLINGRNYYIRAYAKNGNNILYGKESSFQTLSGKSVVSTTSASNITISSATSGGIVSLVYGDKVIKKGICWDTVATFSFTKSLGHIESATEFGYFSCELTGLNPNRNYYVAAYSITSVDTSLGNVISFKTLSGIASIYTSDVTNITFTSASSGGNITNNGGATITARGVCWNSTGNPTVSDSTTIDGNGNGNYASQLTGLVLNKTYYLRAYATNSIGTTYGSQKIFTTPSGIASLTTVDVSDITINSAVSGGNITYNGGADIIARGVCWNTSGMPTLEDNKTDDGAGNGYFTSQLTGLLVNTNYYIRSYAVNIVDTTYGPQLTFKTNNGIPSITTTSISDITINSAGTGGNITSSGSASIISRGVCWNTTGNPMIGDNLTNDGNGDGSFTSVVMGLQTNTIYYLRSYATTIYGTGYGNETSFLTKGLPEVLTASVTEITENSALCGGKVINDWGFPLSSRGICWSTTENPTVDDNKTIDGSGTGTFNSVLTGLTPNTTYYVRAYAFNIIGTNYGSQQTLKTFSGSLTDIEGNKYNTITIGSQLWMAENLKTTKYNDGSVIPLVTDNSSYSNLTTPAYCWYDNSEAIYRNTYGALYNWYTINTNNLCPTGWHIPIDAEWTILTNHLGGINAGGRMKETGTDHWYRPNYGATNISQFTALPGGYRETDGSFNNIQYGGYFWSSSESSSSNAFYLLLIYHTEGVNTGNRPKKLGYSIRCLKD